MPEIRKALRLQSIDGRRAYRLDQEHDLRDQLRAAADQTGETQAYFVVFEVASQLTGRVDRIEKVKVCVYTQATAPVCPYHPPIKARR